VVRRGTDLHLRHQTHTLVFGLCACSFEPLLLTFVLCHAGATAVSAAPAPAGPAAGGAPSPAALQLSGAPTGQGPLVTSSAEEGAKAQEVLSLLDNYDFR
jgi:hypothetical protein